MTSLGSARQGRIRSGLTWLSRAGYLRLAVLTAAAATVAMVIGSLVPWIDPVPAAITAVVTTRPTFHHAAKESLYQVIGVVTGALVAFGAVSLIGPGPATIAILVLASFGIVRLLRVADPSTAPYAAMSVSVTVILVVGAHMSPEGAFERFAGVVLGAICALVASYFTTRGVPATRIAEELESIQEDLAELLGEIAQGVRREPTAEQTRAWLDRAATSRDATLRVAVDVEDMRQHRSWSPAIGKEDVRAVERQLAATQVMSSRILAIAADLNHIATSPQAPVAPGSLSPLASVFEAAAANIVEPGGQQSEGATGVQQAIRSADDTEALVALGGLAAHAQRIARLGREDQAAEDEDPAPNR